MNVAIRWDKFNVFVFTVYGYVCPPLPNCGQYCEWFMIICSYYITCGTYIFFRFNHVKQSLYICQPVTCVKVAVNYIVLNLGVWSTFPIVVNFFVIFSPGPVLAVVVLSSYNGNFIYIQGKLALATLSLGSLTMYTNNGIHYGLLVVFICVHITLPPYHHYADVSESTELLKCLSCTFYPA